MTTNNTPGREAIARDEVYAFSWVIERRPLTPRGAEYWTGNTWSRDPKEALRFCNKEQANKAWICFDDYTGHQLHFNSEVVEHGWLTALLPDTANTPEAIARWKHKKRGSVVTEIGRGKMQSEHWRDTDVDADYDSQRVDMRDVVLYRHDEDGKLWVRPREEFEDGRFERIVTANGVAGDVDAGKVADELVASHEHFFKGAGVGDGGVIDLMRLESASKAAVAILRSLPAGLLKGVEGSVPGHLKLVYDKDKRTILAVSESGKRFALVAEGPGNAGKHVCVYCHSEFLSGEMLAAHLAEVDATNSPGSGNAGLREAVKYLLDLVSVGSMENEPYTHLDIVGVRFCNVRGGSEKSAALDRFIQAIAAVRCAIFDLERKALALPASIPAPVVDREALRDQIAHLVNPRAFELLNEGARLAFAPCQEARETADLIVALLPSAVTADAEAVVLCKRLHIFQIEDEDYIYLTFRGNRITRAKKNSVEASHILRLEADLRSALPPTDRDAEAKR